MSKSSSAAAAAAAKSLQSCPTLCDPRDGSPPGSPVPGILQAKTLEWVAISFSNAWKWKVKVKSRSRVQLLETPWIAAFQAPPSMWFSDLPNLKLLPSLKPPPGMRKHPSLRNSWVRPDGVDNNLVLLTCDRKQSCLAACQIFCLPAPWGEAQGLCQLGETKEDPISLHLHQAP